MIGKTLIKKSIFWLSLTAELFIGVFMIIKHLDKNKDCLKLAMPSHWQTLHPGLQHTLAGDLVLSNQFDALVGIDTRGIIVPLGAKSWTINDDFTVFEFRVDTTKKFSDGSYLSALDYKKAWESSASLTPKSSNNSLLDVLYKIDGFSNFEKTGEIKGIEVIGDDILKIHFTSPFRMALDHLVGNRFAAHKNGKQNTYIGTGDYVITEIDKDKLLLTANPYKKISSQEPISLEYIEANKIIEKLHKGEIDGIPYISGNIVDPKLIEDSSIEVIPGQDALHLTLGLNRLAGHFFSKKCYRQAFQNLILETFRKNSAFSEGPFFAFDPQVFLRSQSGRLSDTQVSETLQELYPCLDEFRKANSSKPLRVVASAAGKAIFDIIKESGIIMTTDSGILPFNELLEVHYKNAEADIVIGSYSVANGDPDGIYHCLGKQGAILSPKVFSQSVSDLLEIGRKLIKIEQLDAHYQKVAKEVLADVPFVHLGFSKAVAVFRKDRVQFNSLTLRRNEGHLDVFELK